MEAKPSADVESSSEPKDIENCNDSSPGPVVLEMELPPASEMYVD
jgi:hypothetical protein